MRERTAAKSIGFVALLVLISAGCGPALHRTAGGTSAIAPPPRIIHGGPDIRTVDGYVEFVRRADEHLPKQQGIARLAPAAQALAGCESEAGRAYAREVIKLLAAHGIDAGPLPGTGRDGTTIEELARIDLISVRLFNGFSSVEDPAPPPADRIPARLYLLLADLIIRQSPGDYSALATCIGTADQAPSDVSMDETTSSEELQSIRVGLWRAMLARFGDRSRTINLSSAAIADQTIDVWHYLFYYAGNALVQKGAQPPPRGRELQNLAKGLVRVARESVKLDPAIGRQEKFSAGSIDHVLEIARTEDRAVMVARAARPDLERFIQALSDRDDAAVADLSTGGSPQSVTDWRARLSLDSPHQAASLRLVGVSITATPGNIQIHVERTDAAGNKTSSGLNFVHVQRQAGRWKLVNPKTVPSRSLRAKVEVK